MLCSCFSRPSTRFEAEAEAAGPQIFTQDLGAAKQAPDALPASAAVPAAAGRMAGKAAVDQISSARDTQGECDSPRKAAAMLQASASPKPAAAGLDAPPSIWEKLASHEIRSLSPTPEPKELSAPTQLAAPASAAAQAACKTPDLTITGRSIKPQPMPAGAAAEAASAAGGKKTWSAAAATEAGMATPPSASRRLSSGGGAAGRKSQAGTPPSAGVPASLLKPTAASAARAQATVKPRSDEAVWKH